MGVALDSFVMTVGYAGIVAIILLAFCLITRFRNDSGKLTVYQRMPVMLPAIGFVITVMLIASAGITPMAQYEGSHTRTFGGNSGDSTSFTMKDHPFYTNSLEFEAGYYLTFNDSIYIDVSISQDGLLVDTVSLDLQFDSMHSTVVESETIALDPGAYDIQVDFTWYEGGVLEENQWLHLTISQPLVEGLTEELVDWTSFQFVINIGCIAFLLAGLCLGSSQQRGPRREEREPEWKPSSKYEY